MKCILFGQVKELVADRRSTWPCTMTHMIQYKVNNEFNSSGNVLSVPVLSALHFFKLLDSSTVAQYVIDISQFTLNFLNYLF